MKFFLVCSYKKYEGNMDKYKGNIMKEVTFEEICGNYEEILKKYEGIMKNALL